jgi:hypothetical protein
VNFALGTNISKVSVTGNLTNNSTINVTNAAGFIATNYTLFTYTGTLSGTPVLGATPTGFTGYTYSLSNNAASKQILFVVSNTAVTTQPSFGNVSAAGGNMIISGMGGTNGENYYVLTSTNVATPLTNWTRLATNQFIGTNFIFTNAIGGNPKLFYRLQLP